MFTPPLQIASSAFRREMDSLKQLASRDWNSLLYIPDPPADHPQFFGITERTRLLRSWPYREMLLARAVDNLATCCSEVVGCVLEHEEEVFEQESQKLKVMAGDVLAVACSASQVRSLILQRKLEEVEGYRRADFVAFLNRYNLGPSLSKADVERWQSIVDRRNAIVHRRGRLERRWSSATRKMSPDSTVSVSADSLRSDLNFLESIASKVFDAVGKKWGLSERGWYSGRARPEKGRPKKS
jgi:hypothetical protein